MKYIKLYEEVDFDENDFDWIQGEESERPIPNGMPDKFYRFLVNNDALDRWIQSFNSGWYKEFGFYNYFNETREFDYIWDGFGFEDPMIDYWIELNNRWRDLIEYKKTNESIEIEDDWDWEEYDPNNWVEIPKNIRLRKGTKVMINPNGRFSSQGRNRKGVRLIGEIEKTLQEADLIYCVLWEPKNHNTYGNQDLLVKQSDLKLYEEIKKN